MLIQQRQSFKQGWSNLWDITVVEVLLQAIPVSKLLKRVIEELGVRSDFFEENLCVHNLLLTLRMDLMIII